MANSLLSYIIVASNITQNQCYPDISLNLFIPTGYFIYIEAYLFFGSCYLFLYVTRYLFKFFYQDQSSFLPSSQFVQSLVYYYFPTSSSHNFIPTRPLLKFQISSAISLSFLLYQVNCVLLKFNCTFSKTTKHLPVQLKYTNLDEN